MHFRGRVTPQSPLSWPFPVGALRQVMLRPSHPNAARLQHSHGFQSSVLYHVLAMAPT